MGKFIIFVTLISLVITLNSNLSKSLNKTFLLNATSSLIFENFIGKYYEGKWSNPKTENNSIIHINGFEKDNGQIIVQHTMNCSYLNYCPEIQIDFIILDGEYIDHFKILTYIINITDLNYSSDYEYTYKNESSLISMYDFKNNVDCNSSFFITFNTLKNESNLYINSSQCNLNVEANYSGVDFAPFCVQVISFTIIFTLLISLSILSAILEVRKSSFNSHYSKRISIASTMLFSISNLFVAFFQFITGLYMVILIKYVTIPFILLFSYSLIIQIQLVVLSFKSQNIEIYETAARVRSELMKCNLKIYLVLFIGLIIIFRIFFDDYALLLIISFPWVPQIIHNMAHITSKAPSTFYILSNSILQIYPYLYYKVYDKNYIRKKPSIMFGISLIILMSIQVSILLLQKIKGSRFLIPRYFSSLNYSYSRQIHMNDIEKDKISDDCVICLIPLNRSIDNSRNVNEYYETPCNHKFHPECLKNWLLQKRQCPTCRVTIPVIDDLE